MISTTHPPTINATRAEVDRCCKMELGYGRYRGKNLLEIARLNRGYLEGIFDAKPSTAIHLVLERVRGRL